MGIYPSYSVCKLVWTAADYSVMRDDRNPGPSSNIPAFLLQKVLSSVTERYICEYMYAHTQVHPCTHIHTQQSLPAQRQHIDNEVQILIRHVGLPLHCIQPLHL